MKIRTTKKKAKDIYLSKRYNWVKCFDESIVNRKNKLGIYFYTDATMIKKSKQFKQ